MKTMLVSTMFMPESKIAPTTNCPLFVDSDPSGEITGATIRTGSPGLALSFFARLTPMARPGADAAGAPPLAGTV